MPLPCACLRSKNPCAFRPMRGLVFWTITLLSQVMSPTFSTISTSLRRLKFSSRSRPATRGPCTCMTRKSVTTPAKRSLHHFIQEREKPTDRRQAYKFLEERLLPSQSLSVGHVRTFRFVNDAYSSNLATVVQEPFFVRTCTVFFTFTSASLVHVSTTQFCSFSPVSWHVRAMERMYQFLRYLPPLRIWVLPTAVFLTSKEQDTVPVRWRRKLTKCSYTLRSRYSCRASPGSKIASRRFPDTGVV